MSSLVNQECSRSSTLTCTVAIELLEKIVLHGPSDSEFHTNRNLQNLLILTAIKAEPSRVSDYLNRLDNYDGPDIARIAISDQYQLYEEGFFIYKKFKLGEEAVTVLLEHIGNVQRAIEFAEYWDKPEVWAILGRALLDHDRTQEAIGAFLKANDPVSLRSCFISEGLIPSTSFLFQIVSSISVESLRVRVVLV